MQQGHSFWEKTIGLAENCSWKAGHYLAKRMKENAFLSWERVVAICDGEQVIGFCTLTEKDELPEKYDYKPFIGYIFVDERFRGNRYSEKMINQVADRIQNEVFGGRDYINPEDLAHLREIAEPLYVDSGTFNMTREELEGFTADGCRNTIRDGIRARLAKKEAEVTSDRMREMDHIDAMQDLRNGITLRAYGNTDPVVAYKNEGYDMFEAMISDIREETVRMLLSFRLATGDALQRRQVAKETSAVHGDASPAADKKPMPQPIRHRKIGVNDPCPCGSGKKYKKCCGANPNSR